jgi:dihydrofolate synthase/folylpolyglutamate synthase
VALKILKREAQGAGTDLGTSEQWKVTEDGTGWLLSGGSGSMALPYPLLLGEHQLQNAALAARACLALRAQGWALPDGAVRSGLASARWPGRLERVGRAPEVFLDGAHNPEGCEALARFLETLPGTPKALVFAAMRDKPIEAMAAPLLPFIERIWATAVPMARCMAPDEMGARLAPRSVQCVESPEEALKEASAWVGRDGCVVVAGSLYLVGYLKMAMGEGVGSGWGTGL